MGSKRQKHASDERGKNRDKQVLENRVKGGQREGTKIRIGSRKTEKGQAETKRDKEKIGECVCHSPEISASLVLIPITQSA